MPFKRYKARSKRRVFRRGGLRRRFSRYGRKRTFLPKGRYTRRSKLTKSISYNPNPQADFQYVKLKYHDRIQLTPAVGNYYFDSYLYRANGCFDPDFTCGGHQPYGYDQWGYLYNNYTVLASSITAVFEDVTLSNQTGLRCFVAPASSSASLRTQMGSSDYITEFPNIKYTDFTVNATSTKRIKHYQTSGQTFGYTNQIVSNNPSTMGASTGADPSIVSYWHVCAQPTISTTATCYVKVTIVYYIKFWNRRIMSYS